MSTKRTTMCPRPGKSSHTSEKSEKTPGRLPQLSWRFFLRGGRLEHAALSRTTDGATIGRALAVIGGEMAGFVLLSRTAPALVVATEHRNRLLFGAENQSFEALSKIHAAILRGQKGRLKRREDSRRSRFGQFVEESATWGASCGRPSRPRRWAIFGPNAVLS